MSLRGYVEGIRSAITGVDVIRAEENGPIAAANDTRFREKTWAGAIPGDADSILLPRHATVRDRARHEERNNPLVASMTQTAANYIVGRGPKLRVRTDDETFNGQFEQAWRDWALDADFAGRYSFGEMLHLSEKQLFTAGEYFWVERFNSKGELRYQIIESDRVLTPGLTGTVNKDRIKDGFEFDEEGRVVAIHVSKRHPGDRLTSFLKIADFDRVPIESVIHEGNWDRPEQTRGTPKLMSLLNLMTDHRRFRNATVLASETAAQLGLVIETQDGYIAAAGQDFDPSDPDEIPFEAQMASIMPAGYRAKQVSPEHPGTNYEMFEKVALNEAGAGVGIPRNLITMDSSDHNYASGRLDLQSFRRNNEVRREEIIDRVLRRKVLPAFAEQFTILTGASTDKVQAALRTATFLFDGEEHIDPVKEATANLINLKSRVDNRTQIAARKGDDIEVIEKQRQREDEKIAEAPFHDNTELSLTETNEDGGTSTLRLA